MDYFGLHHDEDHLQVIRNLRDLAPENAIIVEVGAYVGGSTQAFVGNGNKVYCIDPWHWDSPDYDEQKDPTMKTVRKLGGGSKFFQTFCDNLKDNLFIDVFPIRAYSTEAASIFPFKIDLIFFDDEHTYKAFSEGFKAWKHLFKPSTIIAMDDYGDYFGGLKEAINEIIGYSNLESFHPNWEKERTGIVHCRAEKIWNKIV